MWVFDVTSGELRNLTDEGVDEYELGEPNEGAEIDLLPSWSPDGETIRFARGGDDSESMRLVTIPADGGEVSELRQIRCATPLLRALAWSATQVVWACGAQETEVLMAGQNGGGADVVLPGKEGEDRMLVSFSPDGQWLLVDSGIAYTEVGDGGGLAVAVPVDGGDPVPVADGDVAYPTWSPGGHAIAYVDRKPDTLKVVAEPGGEPWELHTANAFAAPGEIPRLYWAPDRLLVSADGRPVLLDLEESS